MKSEKHELQQKMQEEAKRMRKALDSATLLCIHIDWDGDGAMGLASKNGGREDCLPSVMSQLIPAIKKCLKNIGRNEQTINMDLDEIQETTSNDYDDGLWGRSDEL